MAVQLTAADTLRKRASAVGNSILKRSKHDRIPLAREQKALNALADTEDWLDGKLTGRTPAA